MSELLGQFTRVCKLLRVAADEAMSQHGVRVGQNLLLEVLWTQDGVTPGELAERLHLATPTVVKSANRMEASGLLIRRRDPDDARLVRLYLTDHARSVQQAISRERHALERRILDGLTAEERRALDAVLAKIIMEFGDTTMDADPVDEP